MTPEQQHEIRLGRMYVRAWLEPEFRDRLKSSPHETLAEYGVHIPAECECEVVFDEPSLATFVIPARPTFVR